METESTAEGSVNFYQITYTSQQPRRQPSWQIRVNLTTLYQLPRLYIFG
jgi:hypothetical protein